MSDFDKYFAERLDEEGQFPNRGKNWQQLSMRLNAFDSGMLVQTSRLRYWQAAAAISVLSVSLLFGMVYQMHRENARLREQMAGLHDKYITPAFFGAPAMVAALLPVKQADASSMDQAATPNAPISGTWNEQETDKSSVQQELFRNNADIPPKAPDLRNGETSTANQSNETAANPEIFPEIRKDAAAADHQQTSRDEINGVMQQLGPAQPKEDMSPLAPLPLIVKIPGDGAESSAAVKAASVNLPLIKPFRHNFSKYRIGVQTTVGLPIPAEKGVSPLTGAGFTAEYTVLPNLRVNASADWLYHEINTDTFLARHHFPHHPPKPKFGYKLAQVEGNQRSQYYSLGITYSLPLHFPVRPVLRLAHTWAHWAPSFYNIRYERKWAFIPFKPKNESEPKKAEADWTSNNWRLGAGLEYESSRWVLGLWADYSKNLKSPDPVFDVLFLRAGLEYKFD